MKEKDGFLSFLIMQMIVPLLSALSSNTALLRKAIWWITTNTAHGKKLEIDIDNVLSLVRSIA